MDRSQSQNIVKDTFQNAFSKERFVYFVKNLLNNIEEATFIYRGKYIPDAYQDYINTFERIGKYSDGQAKIDLLIVHLKRETSIERARTMQRNFIAWYLNGSRGNEMKDAALVAFVSPNQDDWRFSLVKMDYKYEKGENKIKVKEEFTPARRWSFLVGKNENSHTAQSRFAPIISDDINNPILSELEEAFNIEKVTKEFFEKYRELFLWTKDELDKMISKDAIIRKDFEEKSVNTTDFAKKLLGQIVFLYFLQKKGWFGVKRDENWGTGPKNFLRQLFEKKHSRYNNFFNDILEPLFYEALAKEREEDYYSRFNCKIPFLNGGLFDPINNYSWVHTDILMDNDLFSNEKIDPKTKDKGTGILDVFDRYNFTVKEDEPLEKEVAVDPEMLGKVFENLLQVKDRKSKGTYYTPREIVHYMCQQSLINYLKTETGIDNKTIEKIVKQDILLTKDDYLKWKKEKEKKDSKILALWEGEWRTLDKALENIKIADPACGSGAFLVGMLQEIVKARKLLQMFSNKKDDLYSLKEKAIRNNIYGVDIDPGAVEIAKLRLWLSLIVDEDEIKHIKPLPNLDYKIMQGNSLLEDLVIGDTVIKFNLDKLVKVDKRTKNMKDLFHEDIRMKLFKDKSEDIFAELKKLHSLFFEENNKTKKLQLKQRIDEKEESFIAAKCEEEIEKIKSVIDNTQDNKKIDKAKQQIKAIRSTLHNLKKQYIKPFFLWKLHFGDVFQEKGGFDVVIANPPYIDSEAMVKIDKPLRNFYAKFFETAKGNWDIFIIFIEKGLSLLKFNGIISYITPNKLIGARYSEKIRELLLHKNIIEIRDYSQVNVFKEADVYLIVFVIQNNLSRNSVKVTKMLSIEDKLTSNNISKDFFYRDIYWDKYFYPNQIVNLILHISNNKSLNEFCDYINDASTVSEAYEIKKYIIDKPIHGEYKKFINTGTIDPYISLWSNQKTQYIKNSYLKPIISNHDILLINKRRLNQSQSKKIIIGGMSKRIECFYDEGEYLAGKSTLIITEDTLSKINIKFLLAILNSKLITLWYQKYFGSLSLAGGYLQINGKEIGKIPIPKFSVNDQKNIVEIVNKIHAITKDDDYLENYIKQVKVGEYEKQIDRMVYKLYGLTPEEIKIVEKG